MSKATDNLEALISMDGTAAALNDARTALERLEPEPGQIAAPDADDEGKAKFGTPEAIATAVAASFVLGPLGGLLIGGAQGWLQRRSDQSILDTLAQDNAALSDAGAVYDEQLTMFKASATNDEDLQQVALLEAQKTAALGMMTSGIAETRTAGMQAFSSFEANMQDYAKTQETQRIAAEALEAQQRIELDDRQYARFTKLQDDFTNESAGYLEVTQATNTALEALQSGTPADLHAAVVLVNKALDPESVVRAEEAKAFGNMGSLLEKGFNIVQSALDGQSLTASQTRNLEGLLNNIQGQARVFQLIREKSYSDQIADANLPTKYHDNFRLVENVPAGIVLDIPEDRLERERARQAEVATEFDILLNGIDTVVEGGEERLDQFIDVPRADGITIVDLAENAKEAVTGLSRFGREFLQRATRQRPTN